MSKIVAVTDYEKYPYKIPGAVSVNSGEGANADLQAVLDEYEIRFLYDVLGKVQGDQFYAALDDIANAEQRWKDLLQGKDEYPGMKPIIQPYIYCYWLRQDEIRLTNSGAGKPKVKGHYLADYNQKFVDAWTRMLILYQNTTKDYWGHYYSASNSQGYFPTTLKEHIDNTSDIEGKHFKYLEAHTQLGF